MLAEADMAETRHSVDIDLTTVPAQRVSHEDTLEVIHHPVARPEVFRAARPDRRMWLALLALAAVAGFGVGIPAGLLMTPAQTAPAPSPDRNDLGGLLDPLGAQPPQPVSPTDQQDLINQLLSPGAG
jgi:hypothetical protein